MFESAEFCVSLKHYNEQIARTTLVICIISTENKSLSSLISSAIQSSPKKSVF